MLFTSYTYGTLDNIEDIEDKIMEKGQYKVNSNMEFKDSHLSLKVGDIYELMDSHKNEKVDISIRGQKYTVDQNALTKCSKAMKY